MCLKLHKDVGQNPIGVCISFVTVEFTRKHLGYALPASHLVNQPLHVMQTLCKHQQDSGLGIWLQGLYYFKHCKKEKNRDVCLSPSKKNTSCTEPVELVGSKDRHHRRTGGTLVNSSVFLDENLPCLRKCTQRWSQFSSFCIPVTVYFTVLS